MFFLKNIGIRAAATRRRRITGSAWKNFPGTAHTDRHTDRLTGSSWKKFPGTAHTDRQTDRHCNFNI
jgi:hypothetical protein